MKVDSYFTLGKLSEGLYKEKGSKFICYGYPISTEVEIKELLDQIKKEHHSARHYCYAYRLGPTGENVRFNDDGEPSGTAGKPIYGQLEKHKVTNTLAIVVRYFGGTLLGTSGLIRAYRNATQDMLNHAEIKKRKIYRQYLLKFGYEVMGNVMQTIKQSRFEEVNVRMDEACQVTIKIIQSKAGEEIALFQNMSPIEIVDQGYI